MFASQSTADHTDPLRSFGVEAGSLVPVTSFPFDLLEDDQAGEMSIPLSQAASALSRILDWIGRSRDFNFSGAKAAALAALLGCANSPYRNLSQIARAAGISRATLSKAVLDLRDSGKIRLAGGKMDSARQTYRETQLELVRLGKHASVKTKKPRNEGEKMNQKVKAEFKTLDAATDEIGRLRKELAAKTVSQPVIRSTTTPKPVVLPQYPAKPAPVTTAAPRLEDLSTAEITEAMDICNREHNSEALRMLYRELQQRRRPI